MEVTRGAAPVADQEEARAAVAVATKIASQDAHAVAGARHKARLQRNAATAFSDHPFSLSGEGGRRPDEGALLSVLLFTLFN